MTATTALDLLYFYPRPPRGGRPEQSRGLQTALQDFYPRPPRGGRPLTALTEEGAAQFLPTPSARRATNLLGKQAMTGVISTHALREEGDPVNLTRESG